MDRETTTLQKTFRIYEITPALAGERPFMNATQLHRFFVDLGKHVVALQHVNEEFSKAFFALINVSSTGKLTFEEFVGWWRGEFSKRGRYDLFPPPKRRLVVEAWRLYHRFTIGNTIPYRMFDNLMSYMKVTYADTDFDYLDTNSDGVLSFSEFCSWLRWF